MRHLFYNLFDPLRIKETNIKSVDGSKLEVTFQANKEPRGSFQLLISSDERHWTKLQPPTFDGEQYTGSCFAFPGRNIIQIVENTGKRQIVHKVLSYFLPRMKVVAFDS